MKNSTKIKTYKNQQKDKLLATIQFAIAEDLEQQSLEGLAEKLALIYFPNADKVFVAWVQHMARAMQKIKFDNDAFASFLKKYKLSKKELDSIGVNYEK